MPQLASCGIAPFQSARCHTASGVAAPFAVLRGGLGVKFLGKIFTPYGRKDFTKNFLPGLACLRFASYAQTWLRLSSPHTRVSRYPCSLRCAQGRTRTADTWFFRPVL